MSDNVSETSDYFPEVGHLSDSGLFIPNPYTEGSYFAAYDSGELPIFEQFQYFPTSQYCDESRCNLQENCYLEPQFFEDFEDEVRYKPKMLRRILACCLCI